MEDTLYVRESVIRYVGRKRRAVTIESPAMVREFLKKDLKGLQQEKFMVVAVNNKNRVMAVYTVSIGTVSEAIVHPREVFRQAIKHGASAVIVCHNHPTGELSPSREDTETTKRLVEAGRIVGIPVLDHVIFSDDGYLSFKEQGSL